MERLKLKEQLILKGSFFCPIPPYNCWFYIQNTVCWGRFRKGKKWYIF